MNGKLILDCLGEIDEFHINDDEFEAIAQLIKIRKIIKYSVLAVSAFLAVIAIVLFVFKRKRGETA